MARTFGTAGVVGLGTMGAGIVEVLARNGLKVVGVERDAESLERGRGHVQHSTDRAVKRGKLDPAEQQAIFDRITFTSNMDHLADAEVVIEAVPEQLALKREVFAALDKVVAPEAVLATNTSSLSVTEIAVATQRPRRVVGMHFFNPAPVQDLVEVVRTVVTEPAVVEEVIAFGRRLGKSPVVIGDRAGFIANALLFGYLNHAVAMYDSRYVSRTDVDAAMVLGCGYPMGPLALLDLIGLDTAYEILDTMYRQDRNRLHAPSPLLRQLVSAGLRGRKTGRGFYTYESPGSARVVPDGQVAAEVEQEEGPPREVGRVGVVGSGAKAASIAEVLSGGGYDVVLVDRESERTGRALRQVADADLVIEAVVEELSVKQEVFRSLDETCRPGAILATTTSSLPVIACAAATTRPADVVGLHFFDPAAAMRLVEVVRTVSTADDVVSTARALCRSVDKHPVTCGDRAGFVVNALLFPYLNDAVKMLEAHYAGVDDIDTAMRLGCRVPMGPFELLDLVGLDVALAIQRSIFREFREPGFAPAPLLEQLVTAGHLGRKSGRGFREHPNAVPAEPPGVPSPPAATP